MPHNPFSNAIQARPVVGPLGLSASRLGLTASAFSDARLHGFQGPPRSVVLPNAASPGGSTLCKSQDGERCVVAGRESLRVLRIYETSDTLLLGDRDHFRIDASRNFWIGSNLKVDSALTDVVWCQKAFDTKILTGTRSGELIMWDVHKASSSRYERRIKGHRRAINNLSYSPIAPYYCSTGSSDGNLCVWDLRDLSKATHSIHHNSSIRTATFSPAVQSPLHAITGLDNGTICRWDLRMGQKGQLERVLLAHMGPILSFDWYSPANTVGGWLASAGLDRTVKVWDFTDANFSQAHSSTRKPIYMLHPSYPVRRVAWRPLYEMELAIASNHEYGFEFSQNSSSPSSSALQTRMDRDGFESTIDTVDFGRSNTRVVAAVTHGSASRCSENGSKPFIGDAIEIWDVRREWVAKWIINGSSCEGGVSDLSFADSHALWVQHPSGAFSQMDLRYCDKAIDPIPRSALTWTPAGSLTFVDHSANRWEIPYDDIDIAFLAGAGSETSTPRKKLGDAPYVGTSQTIGTLFGVTETEDWDVFTHLADNYRIEGTDKATLCMVNADIALNAGNEDAGRIWLLLHTCLTGMNMKDLNTLVMPKVAPRALLHSVSSPAVISASKPPFKQTATRSSSPSENAPAISATHSPARSSSRSLSRSSAFPDVSNNVIGQERSGGIAPSGSPHDRRRQTINISPLNRPRPSTMRRASVAPGHQIERSSANRSCLRQIGEGALDDSDSSSSYRKHTVDKQRDPMRRNSIEELRRFLPRKRFESSPLVHEDHEWAEDEKEEEDDEDDSVSPASSSNDESDDSVVSTTAAQLSSRSRSTRAPSRRRSALAPSSVAVIPSIKEHDRSIEMHRTESQSSVLTIIANGGGGYTLQNDSTTFTSTSAMNDASVSTVPGPADRASFAHSSLLDRRRRSQLLVINNAQPTRTDEEFGSDKHQRFVQWNHVVIKETERQYLQTLWGALKEILEELADNGDIQMCAMLACIAPMELGIKPIRALQFVESYIAILSRLRLHAASAYIRKYSNCSAVREATQVQTTIYTLCAKCRKPLMQPVTGHRLNGGRTWDGYNYCLKCKAAVVICTICHLPVRSALFICAVCSHGGHRDCYHRFYTQQPMEELTKFRQISDHGRNPMHQELRSTGLVPDESDSALGASETQVVRVMGYPCAAGCGHFCWTAGEKLFT